MPRYFRLEEARLLLTRVEQGLRQAIRLKQAHDLANKDLQAMAQRVNMMGGVLLDREHLLRVRARRDATAMRFKEIVEEINETGCQIKDVETGLIDFPTLYKGEEVLLCWRLGEADIEFWHGLEEGYRGRKPIDEDFREHHEGDARV